MLPDPSFWQHKRVFVTGHTGFKGGWLSLWLHRLGAEVKGYALAPERAPNLFNVAGVDGVLQSEIGDVNDLQQLQASMVAFDPDIVIHLAAQPLVRRSYREPIATYETNVMGTVKLLEAARACAKLRSVVCVTTDKCYENREWSRGYREEDAMGGYDPYSSSKGCAELVIAAYRRSFLAAQGVGVASARAGNAIGGGDWSEDRLVPDLLHAFARQALLQVRYPMAIRPWQHVLEPLCGYLLLAEQLYRSPDAYAEAWNFGPRDGEGCSAAELLDMFVRRWGDGARWQAQSCEPLHEAGVLKLDSTKAMTRLAWQPRWSVDEAVQQVVDWHRAWMQGRDMQAVCLAQIRAYEGCE